LQQNKKSIMRCMFAKRLCVWLQFLLTCDSKMIVKTKKTYRLLVGWHL
jgi:hypothetical protein